jgi:hypothetical protein
MGRRPLPTEQEQQEHAVNYQRKWYAEYKRCIEDDPEGARKEREERSARVDELIQGFREEYCAARGL